MPADPTRPPTPAEIEAARRNAHVQRLTAEDRDGYPIPPTCAHCGCAEDRCAGVVVTPEVQREAAESVVGFADRLGMWQGYPLIEAFASALATRDATIAGLRAALTAALARADVAVAEAATMREWAETAAKAENENARDLAAALERVREVERERDNAQRNERAVTARAGENSDRLRRALKRAEDAERERDEARKDNRAIIDGLHTALDAAGVRTCGTVEERIVAIPAERDALMDDARAAVVRYLRGEAANALNVLDIADDIEAGAHVKPTP